MRVITIRTIFVFSLTFLLLLTPTLSDSGASSQGDLPPIRTEVKFQESATIKSDDPEEAWEEWGETRETRKNPFPRRQRKIEPGMDINTVMGMAMRQPKVVLAVLSEQFGANKRIGDLTTIKFKNQLAAAGVGCQLWFVLQGRQVVAKCDTIRDGHMAKDYMIRQPEIIRTVLDNVPFTPRPSALDDDEDDDDDDDDDYQTGDAVKDHDQIKGETESEGKQDGQSDSESREEL